MTAEGIERSKIAEVIGRTVHACASRGVLLGIRKERSAVLANRKHGRDIFWSDEERVAQWRKNVARQYTLFDRMIRGEEMRQCNRAGITGIKGKQHSFETRSKISAALIGRNFTPDHRAKIAKARKRYWIRWRITNGKSPKKHKQSCGAGSANNRKTPLPEYYGLPVSMTFPQSMRDQCSVGDKVIQLSPTEARVLELLLLRGAGRFTAYSELIDMLWPNPDFEPEDVRNYLKVYVCKLRSKGIAINTWQGNGIGIADC
jgi:hypothetical protein